MNMNSRWMCPPSVWIIWTNKNAKTIIWSIFDQLKENTGREAPCLAPCWLIQLIWPPEKYFCRTSVFNNLKFLGFCWKGKKSIRPFFHFLELCMTWLNSSSEVSEGLLSRVWSFNTLKKVAIAMMELSLFQLLNVLSPNEIFIALPIWIGHLPRLALGKSSY